MKAEHIKNGALALLAAAGGLLAQALGGWDTALQSLIFCMAVDYLTGMLVAGVFRRSGKTESGALDSRAGKKHVMPHMSYQLILNKADGTKDEANALEICRLAEKRGFTQITVTAGGRQIQR